MANPVLNENIFKKQSYAYSKSDVMTVGGTATKTLLLLFMVIAGAAYTWKLYYNAVNPQSITGWMFGGLIVAFILAMIISFKPNTAPFLSAIYAAGEGLALGGISAIFNEQFALTYPNIVTNAVALTMVTALVMLTVYRSGIIKVNGTFMKVLSIAMISILVFYLGTWLVSLFGVNLSMLHNSSPLSIGISFIIVAVAAFSLLADYEFIKQASAAGVPKYMEWYGAFGLTVTLVWLYMEILKLLGKFANRE